MFFFFNHPATTEIYTLSLHDALPICREAQKVEAVREHLPRRVRERQARVADRGVVDQELVDRKSTRLNSSHSSISYAVFCLKKKKKKIEPLSHHRNNMQLT